MPSSYATCDESFADSHFVSLGPPVTICLQLRKLSWRKKKKNIFHDVIHRFIDCSQDKIAYNVNKLRNYFSKEILEFRTLSFWPSFGCFINEKSFLISPPSQISRYSVHKKKKKKKVDILEI